MSCSEHIYQFDFCQPVFLMPLRYEEKIIIDNIEYYLINSFTINLKNSFDLHRLFTEAHGFFLYGGYFIFCKNTKDEIIKIDNFNDLYKKFGDFYEKFKIKL